jgi:hypothetical protein
MDNKEINSPKLTARFLIFIIGFVLLMLVVAHFLLRWLSLELRPHARSSSDGTLSRMLRTKLECRGVMVEFTFAERTLPVGSWGAWFPPKFGRRLKYILRELSPSCPNTNRPRLLRYEL